MSDLAIGLDTLERSGDHLSIKLAPQVTINNITGFFDAIKTEMDKPGITTIGLDGSICNQIDTSGFQVLVALITLAKEKKISFNWLGFSETMLETSRLLGLQKTIGIA
ncbi:MAG: STAS domain-containing protein [Pseudomonadales bacterium]|nr:STAS domain-containing protein [Pseudomonadales bacterium]